MTQVNGRHIQVNFYLAVAVVAGFICDAEAVVFVISGIGHRIAGVAVGYGAIAGWIRIQRAAVLPNLGAWQANAGVGRGSR